MIRKFLGKTWGTTKIDEALFRYQRINLVPGMRPTTSCPDFFSKDILTIYERIRQRVWMVHGKEILSIII